MQDSPISVSPAIFQALAIAKALRLYHGTGMRVNSAYTPINMRLMAEKITSKKFKSRAYLEMAAALEEFAHNLSTQDQL